MKRNEFLEKLNEVVQVENDMTPDTVLATVEEWDSLSLIAALSLFQHTFGFRPDLEQLKGAKTAADILNLADGKYTE